MTFKRISALDMTVFEFKEEPTKDDVAALLECLRAAYKELDAIIDRLDQLTSYIDSLTEIELVAKKAKRRFQ